MKSKVAAKGLCSTLFSADALTDLIRDVRHHFIHIYLMLTIKVSDRNVD